MQIKQIVLLLIISSILIPATTSMADESTVFEPYTSGGCKPYSTKQLESIKASNNSNLMAGAGSIDFLTNPTSTEINNLLSKGSHFESPKGPATVALIIFQLNRDLPLKPLKDQISDLKQGDKENALSYYLNALLLQEESKNKEALEQIIKGNHKIYNGYVRERFYSSTDAAQIANCRLKHSRHLAFFSAAGIDVIPRKLRHLCRNLTKAYGREARDACSLMGRKLEEGSLTCLGKIFSLNIQSDSLDESPTSTPVRAEIKRKWQSANDCGEGRALDIEETNVTEEADSKFYEIFLAKGEAAAQEFLADFVKQIL